MSSNQFFTLANWDGSLTQPASSASSSSSAHRQAVNLNQGSQRTTEEQPVAEEELRRQSVLAMPPPPVPQTPVRGGGPQWTAHASSYDPVRRDSWSAMSISSESSFSNNDEERRRVEGMLLTSDDLMASSPPKLEHHWQVPATVLTPEMADESNAWNPQSHKSPSNSVSWLQAIPPALLDEHGQLTLMDVISSLPPPVGPAMNPTSQGSSSSKRKSSSEPEGLQNITTSDEEARRSVPPALSFSPSHYPTSELPALLGEDITVDLQPTQHDSIPATLSKHKPSSRPESDPIAPPTPTSLLDSFNDAFNSSPRRLSPEVPMTFADLQPNADLQPGTSSFGSDSFWTGLDKEAFVALAMGYVPQLSEGAEEGSDSTVARPDLQVHTSVQDGQSIKDSDSSLIETARQSPQSTSSKSAPTPESLPGASQRELSVVPETPQATSPISPDVPRASHSPAREDTNMRSDSPMRISHSDSPASGENSGPFGSRSTGESTLVEQQSHQVLQKETNVAIAPSLQGDKESGERRFVSSPLSSPPSPIKPLPASGAKTFCVDVPPLSAHHTREHARPISTYIPDIHELPPPRKRGRPPKNQKAGSQTRPPQKRKRSEAVESSSTRAPRPKKPRLNDKLKSPAFPESSPYEIGLESLGPEARDVFARYLEYLEVEIDCNTDTDRFEERFGGEARLEEILRLVLFRRFGFSRGLQERRKEALPVVPSVTATTSAALAKLSKGNVGRSTAGAPQKSPSRRRVLKPASPPKPGPSSEQPVTAAQRQSSATVQHQSSATVQHQPPVALQHQPPATIQHQPPSQLAQSNAHAFAVHPDFKVFPPPAEDRLDRLTVVRDRDVFLGVQDEPYDGGSFIRGSHVEKDDTRVEPFGYPSSSSHFGEVPNASFTGPSYVTPNFGHEGAVFYGTDGTIDPTLLAPPPDLTNQFRTPSPSPTPSSPDLPLRTSLSRATTSIVEDVASSFAVESDATSDSQDEDFSPRQKKSKGKERASDVGIRARQAEVDPDSLTQRVVGRRDRKPTAKVVEARESVDPGSVRVRGLSVSGAAQSTSKVVRKSVDGSFKPTKGPKPKPIRKIGPNFEGGFCHQCRGNNNYAKMQCRGMRASDGQPCLLLFCEKCILKRYPDSQIRFDLDTPNFICPKCDDYCNCTTCARKRGEVYVSTKHVKTALEIRTKKKAKRRDDDERDDSDYGYTEDGYSDVQIPVPAALPVGQTFGAVYDLTGRKRIGVGIVADGPSQKIVLVSNEPQPSVRKAVRKRQFIGQPHPKWHSTAVEEPADPPLVRAYVGKRGPLFNVAAYKSFDALTSFEGPLTPPSLDAEEGDETNANLDSPSKPLDAAQLSFTLADLLGTLSQHDADDRTPSAPP